MNIIVKDIPEEGLHLSFKAKEDPWFRQVLKDALEKNYKEGEKGDVELTLHRIGANVDCRGDLHFDSHPVCSRCLKQFAAHSDLLIKITLAPFPLEEGLEEEREAADDSFVRDDEEFSFFDGVEFNLADIIREQIILSLPIQSVCKESCKGLCQHCGKDLNQGACSCQESHEDHRWDVLKGFKVKKRN